MSRTESMNALAETDVDVQDIHSYVERSLVTLEAAAPALEDQQAYFKKNVGAYYRAKNETVTVGQKIKKDGEGNNAARSLTINIANLGIMDRKKVIEAGMLRLNEMGAKMGYDTEEIREAQVIPEVVGKNRMEK